MEKLLDSYWLRAVQFKCYASAKSVTQHQFKLHIVILDYDWEEGNEKFCRPRISCKTMTRILYGNSEKCFLDCEKKVFKKHLPSHFFHVCVIKK